MKGKIVTLDNCKVGDTIMYTKEFLDSGPFYKKIVEDSNTVYLKIIKIQKYTIKVKLIDYKGIVRFNFTHIFEEDKFYFYE